MEIVYVLATKLGTIAGNTNGITPFLRKGGRKGGNTDIN